MTGDCHVRFCERFRGESPLCLLGEEIRVHPRETLSAILSLSKGSGKSSRNPQPATRHLLYSDFRALNKTSFIL